MRARRRTRAAFRTAGFAARTFVALAGGRGMLCRVAATLVALFLIGIHGSLLLKNDTAAECKPRNLLKITMRNKSAGIG